MSYVLDALRKADAERERGAVPGIHAQPVPVMSHESQGARALPWPWIVVGLCFGVALPMAWLAGTRESPRATVGAPPMPAAASAATTAATPAAPVVATAPVAPPAPAAEARPAAPPVAAKPASVVRSAVAKPPPRQASAAAAGDRIYAQHELPEEIRRGLPQIAVNGSMYSPDREGSFIIINGQIFHENDNIAPDLSLEQIKLKAAVLKYKGYRYTITY
jgi:general secretion pathway protein B